MNDRSTLVDRLRRKTVAGEFVFPTPIELEAADRISELEAELAAQKADFATLLADYEKLYDDRRDG
jgi:hypothetical protein